MVILSNQWQEKKCLNSRLNPTLSTMIIETEVKYNMSHVLSPLEHIIKIRNPKFHGSLSIKLNAHVHKNSLVTTVVCYMGLSLLAAYELYSCKIVAPVAYLTNAKTAPLAFCLFPSTIHSAAVNLEVLMGLQSRVSRSSTAF